MSRDFKTSKFKKVVGISIEDYCFLLETKGKKSIAGQLEYIIKEYKIYAKTKDQRLNKQS